MIYALTPVSIYVTSDHGATWQLRGSPLTALSPQPAAGNSITVGNLSVDAMDPARIFIATSRGLLFSDTGGQVWGVESYELPSNENGSVFATWVAVSPLDHSIVYAATGRPSGLFKSTDAGFMWQALNPTYPGEPAASFGYPVVAMLAPDGTDLYVVDTTGNLLKSTDGGGSWQLLAQRLYGARAIVIDSNAPNVYVVDNFGLQKSSDGGLTFTTATLPGITMNAGAQQAALDQSTGTLYAGTQTAIYVSTDAGNTFQQITQAYVPNLHTLVSLGGQTFAGFNTPVVPFVMKLDPTGAQILYSTFIGGSLGDTVTAMAVDSQGNCTIAGVTVSPDFPVTTGIPGASPAGRQSGFITKLSCGRDPAGVLDVIGCLDRRKSTGTRPRRFRRRLRRRDDFFSRFSNHCQCTPTVASFVDVYEAAERHLHQPEYGDKRVRE